MYELVHIIKRKSLYFKKNCACYNFSLYCRMYELVHIIKSKSLDFLHFVEKNMNVCCAVSFSLAHVMFIKGDGEQLLEIG
jgi:hypothetical protein